MSKTYINKIKVYLKQSYREDTKGYILDNSNAIYFTDSYSIVKLFDTTYTRKQRNDILNELKDKFDSKQYNTFENNNLTFDYTKILRIARIIGKNEEISFYTSNECKDAICMVGQNGVAFLLGCKTF